MHPVRTLSRRFSFAALLLFLFLLPAAAAAASDWQQLHPGYPTHGYNDIYVAGPGSAFAVGDFGLIARWDGAAWSTLASPVSANLNAVWGRSASDVFAVGDNGTILHFNGSAWRKMTSPTFRNLHSVWGLAAPSSPVYAGGRNGTILKYAGGTWSFMHTGLADGIWNYTIIYGVWGYSATNLYAVGYKSGDSTEDIYLKCSDGATWQQFTGPTGSDIPAATFPAAIWGSAGGDMFVGGRSGIYRLTNGGSWSANLYPGVTADIWGTSATDIWAVGEGIAHFNGSSWLSVPIPLDPQGRWGGLSAVSGSNSANVFAAGTAGRILRFQGDAWSSMTGIPEYAVFDIWQDAGTSLIAVGEYGMVIRSDGTSWNPMASATNENLLAVCGWGNGRYLAAGVNGTVQYYNGTAWSPVDSDTPQDLNDLWCYGTSSAFAVGTNGTIINCSGTGCVAEITDGNSAHLSAVHSSDLGSFATGGGVLMRKDGTTWNTVTPTSPIFISFTDLWGDFNYGGLVAVGGQYIYSYSISTNTWTQLYQDPGTLYLQKVIGDSFADLRIAGFGGSLYPYSGVILDNSGATIKTFESFHAYTIQEDATGNIYVGGAQMEQNSPWHGQILHFDGNAWTSMIESNPLNDIWGAGLESVFAVGDNGTILHYDGRTVRPMESTTSRSLEAVYAGTSGNWAAAAGWAGEMLHFDGSVWTPAVATGDWINDLWGQGETVYGVGDSGAILRSLDRGATWSPMSSPTGQSLYAVWGAAADGPVFAAGLSGTVLHYNGSAWSQMVTNTNSSEIDFHGVWGSSATDVHVVGDNWPVLGSNETQIIHYNGSSWRESYSSYNVLPPEYLTGIWGRSAADIIAFGTPNLRRTCGRSWQEATDPGIPPLQKGWGMADPEGNYHIFGITAYDSIYHLTIPAGDECASPWSLFLPAILITPAQ